MSIIKGKVNVLKEIYKLEKLKYRNIYCQSIKISDGEELKTGNNGITSLKKVKEILNEIEEEYIEIEKTSDEERKSLERKYGYSLIGSTTTYYEKILKIKVPDKAKEGYVTIFNVLERERPCCDEALAALGYDHMIDFGIAYDIYGQEVKVRERDGSKVISLICKKEDRQNFDVEKFKQLALALMDDNRNNRGGITNGIL